ncbi:hypothetical protein MAPG_00243 [Magnaporthiopsis poae ATCC 64411]|uniref:Uncharacterized protein n=1 Tax=Magnaporthiopsis poae (strain ATCC 64411 / 73-15) TaxID=644358 RepID=A0A0C4DKH1_MAGP6|nr:hypothetical protein MAPG_00243 [Magnaporthiopsis poae ATCC 64411]
MRFSAQAATVLAAVPGVAQGNKTMSPRQATSTIALPSPPASDDSASLEVSAPIHSPVKRGAYSLASWTTLVAVLPVATTVCGRPATVTAPGLRYTRTILTAGPTITRKVAGWVDTSTIYRTVVANMTGIDESSDPVSTSSSSSGFFAGTKTITAASVTVTQVTTTTATAAKPTTPASSSNSKSGSYCCLEGWRPDLEWVGDRHMIANVWTSGWGDERDGCHKGMLDNLRALRGSMDMVWKCRPDQGGGGARAQFSFVTLQGSAPITDIIKVASPGGRDKGVECSLGCPPEKLWDWTKSEWL